MTFGENLRRHRKAAGLSLRELATKLGISPAYLSDIERGNRAPFSGDKLTKVAEVLAESGPDIRAAALVDHPECPRCRCYSR